MPVTISEQVWRKVPTAQSLFVLQLRSKLGNTGGFALQSTSVTELSAGAGPASACAPPASASAAPLSAVLPSIAADPTAPPVPPLTGLLVPLSLFAASPLLPPLALVSGTQASPTQRCPNAQPPAHGT